MILLKNEGYSWKQIATQIGIGSHLAVRNRYQVLIGQQGRAVNSWSEEDLRGLQSFLDAAEDEKWRFIGQEMRMRTGKQFTDAQCKDVIRRLFWEDPGAFGITNEVLHAILSDMGTQEISFS